MAKEYIERDAAIKYLEIHKKKAKENSFVLCANEDSIIKFLREKCPTADVVEVVRCKDCQWFSVHNKNGCYRPGLDHHAQMTPVYENDYCSYGTPKERGGKK